MRIDKRGVHSYSAFWYLPHYSCRKLGSPPNHIIINSWLGISKKGPRPPSDQRPTAYDRAAATAALRSLRRRANTPSLPPRRPLIGYIRVSNNLPHMPVLALEVEPTPLVQVVDLPVRPRARPAPEGDPFVPDPPQDRVEFVVRCQECVVIGARVVRVIEVQRQYVVDLDWREVPPGAPRTSTRTCGL